MADNKKTAPAPAKPRRARSSSATARQTNAKAAAEQKADAAATVGVDVSAAEIAKARREGAIEAEKEAGKDSYAYATDGQLPGDPDAAPRQFPGYDDIQQFAHLLGQGPEAFEISIHEEATVPIPEEKVYGLLALERNGQNRTAYVQAMMKRLGLKANELPGGGPPYTNDVRPITELK